MKAPKPPPGALSLDEIKHDGLASGPLPRNAALPTSLEGAFDQDRREFHRCNRYSTRRRIPGNQRDPCGCGGTSFRAIGQNLLLACVRHLYVPGRAKCPVFHVTDHRAFDPHRWAQNKRASGGIVLAGTAGNCTQTSHQRVSSNEHYRCAASA
jgi:hypothetical protein